MKKFCPILAIGFPPPKTGEKDLRMCTETCAMYDIENDQCSVKSCSEMLTYLSGQLDDNLSLMTSAFIPFEDEDNFDYDPISH